MAQDPETFLKQVNLTRYHNQPQGFYESFFQRANHPSRPLAFWIRYTLFSPKNRPESALGELWFIFFNGETHQHLVTKQEFPLSECVFNASAFQIQVGNARLDSHHLAGALQTSDRAVSWDLKYTCASDPLLLLPVGLYQTPFPAAKSLVGMPLAHYNGRLTLGNETVEIADWTGSQNHNWGIRHTDLYAWGQVAGFDNYPDSFLEVATAKLRAGPLWTPSITPVVLRHLGQEYAIHGLFQSMRNQGSFDYFNWHFKARTAQVEIDGKITAPSSAFVGLRYRNPPGGEKFCLNTKIASCILTIKDQTKGITQTLKAQNRAAFEILTDDLTHGISITA